MINLGDITSLSFLFFLTYTMSLQAVVWCTVEIWLLQESTLPIVLNMRLGMNVPKSLAGFILNGSENSGWQQIPFAPEVEDVEASMGGFLVILPVQSVSCCRCKDRWGAREPGTACWGPSLIDYVLRCRAHPAFFS